MQALGCKMAERMYNQSGQIDNVLSNVVVHIVGLMYGIGDFLETRQPHGGIPFAAFLLHGRQLIFKLLQCWYHRKVNEELEV